MKKWLFLKIKQKNNRKKIKNKLTKAHLNKTKCFQKT